MALQSKIVENANNREAINMIIPARKFRCLFADRPQDVILEDRNVILYDRRINMAGRSVIVAVGERY